MNAWVIGLGICMATLAVIALVGLAAGAIWYWRYADRGPRREHR